MYSFLYHTCNFTKLWIELRLALLIGNDVLCFWHMPSSSTHVFHMYCGPLVVVAEHLRVNHLLTLLCLCTLICMTKSIMKHVTMTKSFMKHVTLWCRLYSFWTVTLAALRAWRKPECHSSEESSEKNFMIPNSWIEHVCTHTIIKGEGGLYDPFFLLEFLQIEIASSNSKFCTLPCPKKEHAIIPFNNNLCT